MLPSNELVVCEIPVANIIEVRHVWACVTDSEQEERERYLGSGCTVIVTPELAMMLNDIDEYLKYSGACLTYAVWSEGSIG